MSTPGKEKQLPDFVIGGAMKCGTTSMHSILESREDVFIPDNEVHFFSIGDPVEHGGIIRLAPDRICYNPNDVKQIKWYSSFFEAARRDQLIGERSTTYLSSRVAPERIHELIPDVKLVFMIRNPVDRTYSHYLHPVNTGRATKTFEQEIIHGPSNLYLRSLYKPQLERYFRLFPRDQIKVVLFERFVEETQTVVDEVCSHLGVPNSIDLEEVETHTNPTWYPQLPKMHLAVNYFLKGKKERYRYRPHWPGEPSGDHIPDVSFGQRLLRSLLPRLKGKIPRRESYPTMDESLRERLTRLYARKNSGIGNLVEVDIGGYWPFE